MGRHDYRVNTVSRTLWVGMTIGLIQCDYRVNTVSRTLWVGMTIGLIQCLGPCG